MTTTPAMPERFTKKPVTVEAVQFKNDDSSYALILWINEGQHAAGRRFASWHNNEIIVPTLEGEHIASVGDWIIKGVKGEFYPCKPDIFEMTYDRAILAMRPQSESDEQVREAWIAVIDTLDEVSGREWRNTHETLLESAVSAIRSLRPQSVPMTPRMVELLAAMEPADQHEDNGSGLVICPACDAYMNMQWKAGQRIDKIEDLAHDEECPAVWARAQLAHGITAPAGGEGQA